MPTGSFDFASYSPQLAMDAIPIGVFLYDASAHGDDDDEHVDDGGPYMLLPNIPVSV